MNRDYPIEIVQARSRLWQLYKSERAKNPPRSVFIGYPAKLIVKGSVVHDEFPDWDLVMKQPRVPKAPSIKRSDPVQQPTTAASQSVVSKNPFSVLSGLDETPDESDSHSDTDDSDNKSDPYSQAMSQLESQLKNSQSVRPNTNDT